MDANRTNRGELEHVYDQTVDALISLAAQRDESSEGHSERVQRYCVAAGKAMALPPHELTDLRYAAALHDIGKIAISRKIIHKLGKLTDEEFAIMKQHSTIAIRVLEKIDGLRGALPFIKYHHERYDGKGYPEGISGENIPIGARVIAVAEAFDILTSDVPWRDALSQEAALAELHACQGTQFDPAVVEAFSRAIKMGLVER